MRSRPWHNPRDLDDPEVRALVNGATLEVCDTTGSRHIVRCCLNTGWHPWQVVTAAACTVLGTRHTLTPLVGVEIIAWRELDPNPTPNGPFTPCRKAKEQ